MMQFFKDANYDFLKYRWIAIGISAVLIAIGLGSLAIRGLNLGIDFTGGSQITLRYKETPDLDQLRGVLREIGQEAATIQRYDDPAKNQVLIRVQSSGREEDAAAKVLEPLTARLNQGVDASKLDLNFKGKEAIQLLLQRGDPDNLTGNPDKNAAEHYDEVAKSVVAARSRAGILASHDGLRGQPGISDKVVDYLAKNTALGNVVLLNAESVGPQVGEQLRNRALLAIIFSTLGMLCYIWVRFDFKFGVGAIVAMIHDVVLTLGILSITGMEVSLTVVAALLTLVGYSVNDTVVIFDRIRENRRANRREGIHEMMNRALNQTLSRTILTALLTMLAVMALYFFGGEVLRTFAFTMWFGIITGSYSTIYIAAAVVYMWESRQNRGAAASAPVPVKNPAKG